MDHTFGITTGIKSQVLFTDERKKRRWQEKVLMGARHANKSAMFVERMIKMDHRTREGSRKNPLIKSYIMEMQRQQTELEEVINPWGTKIHGEGI